MPHARLRFHLAQERRHRELAPGRRAVEVSPRAGTRGSPLRVLGAQDVNPFRALLVFEAERLSARERERRRAALLAELRHPRARRASRR